MRVLLWIDIVLMLVCLCGLVRHGLMHGRGRHVSKPLSRRIGPFGVAVARTFLAFSLAGLVVAGEPLACRAASSVYWLWAIDDVFFSDDDEHKRWEWAKVKLRKCKPVMQRLAQQWKPRAPKVPVPA